MEPGSGEAYAVVPDTLQAFEAINAHIRDGHDFYRAREVFEDQGRSFSAGTLVFGRDRQLASELKRQHRMHIHALAEMPEDLTLMQPQLIAAYEDEGLSHALRKMGFEFDEITASDLNAGIDLSQYDVFVFGNHRTWRYSLRADGVAAIADFVDGGGDFIGLGNGGSTFAEAQALVDVTTDSADGNGIANIDLVEGHMLTTGFAADEFAFIYDPVWFPFVGDGIEVAARLDADALLVSGYLPGWETSPAAGMPVMLFYEDVLDPERDTALIGFDTTFRGHPRNTFRLIGNAVYSTLDAD
jgi:hypothetical protein